MLCVFLYYNFTMFYFLDLSIKCDVTCLNLKNLKNDKTV